MPTVQDQVQELIEPLLVAHALELFDLEYGGGKVVITVDRPGGADVGSIAAATRSISRALDAHDVVPGHYTLEVTSPGLERRLRTDKHFAWAVGRDVKIKLIPTVEVDRRLAGVLESFDPDTATLAVRLADNDETVVVRVADIDRARTVFEWGAVEKPVSPSRANTGPGTARRGGKQQQTTTEKRATAT